MTIFADIEDYVNEFGALTVAIVIVSEKIARCIPTDWQNKTVQKIARFFYAIFAVVGLKAPDIVKVDGGEVITKTQAVAQEIMNNPIVPTESEPKK